MWPDSVAGGGAGGYECGVGWKLPTLAAVLWAVALGVWAGVAAGPIGGAWGAVAGSVLTVLAGVVTGMFRRSVRSSGGVPLSGLRRGTRC
jgi:hypothetical protein